MVLKRRAEEWNKGVIMVEDASVVHGWREGCDCA
jgi:hypothetical protein